MTRGRSQNATIIDDVEEMTVVVLKFKGRGETLRKGFDTVSQAFAAVGAVPTPQQRLSPRDAQTEIERNGNPNGNPDVTHADDKGAVEEASESGVQREVSEERRHYSVPEFLNDFNLDGDGMKWKDYATKKNPETDNERYLVASLWLTKHGGKETFTPDHVFTCFRTMKWKEQKDFSQPLRIMKKRKSYLTSPSRGEWKLTSPGMDAAEAVGSKDATSA